MTPRVRYGRRGRHGGPGECCGPVPGFNRRGRRTRAAEGTLAALRSGEHAVIEHIEDERARAQALRFGMGEGASVSCITIVPAGPVIVRSGRQEIAVGRGLAGRIRVRSGAA